MSVRTMLRSDCRLSAADARPGERGGPVDADQFREVMSGIATPVSIVTSAKDGQPHGTTVSAFASLSMTPPMVLVSLNISSDLLTMVRDVGRFGLNILAVGQSDVATAFARKGGAEKFAGVAWEFESGLPRVAGALGWVECAVQSIVDAGDHCVILGDVLRAHAGDGRPLTYHRRAFGTHVIDDRV